MSQTRLSTVINQVIDILPSRDGRDSQTSLFGFLFLSLTGFSQRPSRTMSIRSSFSRMQAPRAAKTSSYVRSTDSHCESGSQYVFPALISLSMSFSPQLGQFQLRISRGNFSTTKPQWLHRIFFSVLKKYKSILVMAKIFFSTIL